jgi:hypothetical protein
VKDAEHVTPKALASCSPGFPTLGLLKIDGVLTPKVLANSSSELLQSLIVIKQLNPRVRNPGLQLANAFGVV